MISSRAVLISSSLRPSRPACRPGLSSRLVVSPGLSVPSLRSTCRVSARSCSIGSSRLVSSSRYLVLLSCRFYRYLGLPHPWRRREQATGTPAGLFFTRRFPQLVVICLVIRLSSSGRRIVSVPHRGGLGVGSSLSHPSGSSYSSPLSYLITERRRWCLSSFKQATTAWRPSPRFIISSHHLIPSPSWSVSSAVSSHASRWASRPHIPGHQRRRDENEASKRTRKNGEGTGTRNRGVGRDEGRNENGNTTGTGRWQHKNGKQASKQARATETYDAIMGKNKTPLILFRPTPSPWVLIGSPASISPPPPGRGMR